jgi:hypothetical protein
MKTKKEVIEEFLTNSPDTDIHVAYDSYAALVTENTASKGLFRTVWVKVKGAPERKVKSEGTTQVNRNTVLDLYKEQEKFIVEYHNYKIKTVLADTEEEKRNLKILCEKALDNYANINYKIRAALAI